MTNNTLNPKQSDFSGTSSKFAFDDRTRYCGNYSENLGISYSSSTFTINAGDGTALSSNNLAYVNLPSKTSGRQLAIAISSNQNFVDSTGSSEISGNLFGLTAAVATTVDVPFFIYAVLNDSENAVAFMISRMPNSNRSPASGDIGMPSSAVADNQYSFFSLENITATSYDSNPCVCIGSFRMRMNSSNDWAVQALAITDGIGLFQEGIRFSFPRGQFGAATSKYFQNNGGTAPDDAAGSYYYTLNQKSNICNIEMISTAFTGGSGAVQLQMASPFIVQQGSASGWTMYIGVTTSMTITLATPSTQFFYFISTNDVATKILQNSDFSTSKNWRSQLAFFIYNPN